MFTLFSKKSVEIKVLILSLNIFYLFLLPYFTMILMQDYQIKAYINSVILQDLMFLNMYSEHGLVLTFISQNIMYIALAEAILMLIFIIYYAITSTIKR